MSCLTKLWTRIKATHGSARKEEIKRKPNNNGKNLVTSPGYPSNYPDNQDKTFPIKVAAGQVIEILFTDFNLEPHASCEYDHVTVLDGDGSTLLAKTCGTNKPGKITSKTNVANIKFKSDTSVNNKGFRAEWKAVTKTVPVNGGWGSWGGWTRCRNSK